MKIQARRLDGAVILWDISTGKHNEEKPATNGLDGAVILHKSSKGGRPDLGEKEQIWSVAFSSDGNYLAAANVGGTVKVWQTSDYQEVKTFNVGWSIYGITFSPKEKFLTMSGTDDKKGKVELWDFLSEPEKCLTSLEGHTDRVYGVAFSPKEDRLVTAGVDGRAIVWEIHEEEGSVFSKMLHTLIGHADALMGVAFSRTGEFIATASLDETVKVWNTSTGKELESLAGHRDGILSVAFSPKEEQERLATASVDGTVIIRPVSFDNHTDAIYGLAFSPSNKGLLATASFD